MKGNVISLLRYLRILVGWYFILVIAVSTVFAQENIERSVTLLTPEFIAEVNFDQEEFFTYLKHVDEQIKETLKDEKEDGHIIIHFTLHPDHAATIDMYAKPASLAQNMPQLLQQLKTITPPKLYYTDFSWLYTITVNHGSLNEAEHFMPPFTDPIEQTRRRFTALSLEHKKAHIQQWARNEVIPILGVYASQADSQFIGVRAVGTLLTTLNMDDVLDVNLLTNTNSNYWRAVMEMSRGNFLIPASKIFLYVVNGEFDIANRYRTIFRWFAHEQSLATYYLDELAWRFEIFYEEYNQQVYHGIALHDQGKYQEAIDHYTKLLTMYPNSAFAQYERYLSRRFLKLENELDDTDEWKNAKSIVYACDPLYQMDVEAKTAREGYLLVRRMGIASLFQEQKHFKHDVITYADIALDLEVYDFAAELYWLILSYFSPEEYDERNLLAHVLYCLEKLGDTTTKTYFQDNFNQAFQDIEAERMELMKTSETYNAFTTKE